MADDTVTHNLENMDELDFTGWNRADWEGVFTRHHTDDVLVEVHGQPPTHGIHDHIQAMRAVRRQHWWRARPGQGSPHPLRIRRVDLRGRRTRGRSRMVTVARWRDRAIAEEYVWI